MDESVVIEDPTTTGTEANFDGIFDGLLNVVPEGGGIIGIIFLAIVGVIAYFKFGKKTRVLKKAQKVLKTEYKESKKESLEEMKVIDKKTEVILEDIQEQKVEAEVIETKIDEIINDTVTGIEETKVTDKRKIVDTNERLRNILNKIKNK